MSNIVRFPPTGPKPKAGRRVARSHTFLDAPGRPHFAQLDVFDDQVVVRVFDSPPPAKQHRKFIVDSEIEGTRLACRVAGYSNASVREVPNGGIEISLDNRSGDA